MADQGQQSAKVQEAVKAKAEALGKLNAARTAMQSVNSQAGLELNPLAERAERIKLMRTELEKVPKGEFSAAERDECDRDLKAELAEAEAEQKAKREAWQAKFNVEKADADKWEAEVKRLDARIEVYARIEEMLGERKNGAKKAKATKPVATTA